MVMAGSYEETNAFHSRPRSPELSPAVGPVPIFQWVSPIITIIVLSGPIGLSGSIAHCGWLDESRDVNNGGQHQSSDKHLHDTSLDLRISGR
jgi:hypothetical protein